MGIGAVLSVVFFVIAGIARLGSAIRSEVSDARAKREPWLYLFVLWPGILGNALVVVLAGFVWTGGNMRFVRAITSISYWWVPVTVMFASLLIGILERAHEWLPQVPGAITKMGRGWLWLAVAPIASPVRRWRKIQTDRARGQTLGVFAASVSLFGAFLAGILLWPLGTLLPFGIGVIILDAFR
jgi:hypothetical protein